MPRTVDTPASPFLVYTAPWSEEGAGQSSGVPWELRDDLRASHPLRTSGSTPSSCWLWSYRDASDTGPTHSAIPGEARTTRLPGGTRDGTILSGFGLGEWYFVKVVHGSRTVFLGLVTGQRWNRRECRVEVRCQDYRVLMRRRKNRGAFFGLLYNSGTPFIEDLGPHFNADGRPDCYTSSGGDRRPYFIIPGFNRDANGQVDTGTAYADYWSPGDALNALREIWCTNSTPAAIDSLEAFIDWVRAGEDGQWAWLFTDPESNVDRRVMDLDCCGRDLGWAIDQVVAAAGPYDWTLDYVGDRGVLRVYEIFKFEDTVDFSLGTVGGTYQGDLPDVRDSNLELDWSDSYAKVRAVGARKKFDITLALVPGGTPPTVDASSTAVPFWTSGQQTAWLALADTNPEKASQAYPDVFLSFGAPDGTDWSTFSLGNYQEGVRRVLPQLISEALGEAEAEDRPVKLGIRVWRKTSVGGSWELAPANIGVMPLPLGDGRVGVRLAEHARQAVPRTLGGAAETWTWNGNPASPQLYDLRITLCVEADERLFMVAEEDTLSSRWPKGELYLMAGERYQWHLRRSCLLRWDGAKPVVSGGTDHEFGASAVDTVRDDTDEINLLAERRLVQVARPRLRGQVELIGLRPEIFPGYPVGSLTGGGGHPSMDIYSAVRSVEFDEDRQVTVLSFEGV